MGASALAVQVRGGDARVGVLGAVGEGGGQGGGAALVVVRVLASVDGRVDGDGPHGGGVAVAVAVVVLAAVARGPNVDVAQAVATLKRKRIKPLIYDPPSIFPTFSSLAPFFEAFPNTIA